jgi:hypothetical protein
LSAIQDILRWVDHKTLDAIFQEWMIRLTEMVNMLNDAQAKMFNFFF